MNRFNVTILSILYGLSLTVSSLADVQMDSDNFGGYFFFGGKVEVLKKDNFVPIAHVDKKGIFVEDRNGIKRLAKSAPCRVAPSITLTHRYADISGFDFSFSSLARLKRESEAVKETIHSQRAVDMKTAEIARRREQTIIAFGKVESPAAAEALAALLNAELAPLRSEREKIQENSNILADHTSYNISDGTYQNTNLGDVISLKFTVTPNSDIPNAYLAIVLLHEGSNQENEPDGGRLARIHPIGDLMEGQSQSIKIRKKLPEILTQNANVQLLVFSGDGSQVATNLSAGLKAVTTDQAELFIKHASGS